MGLPVRVADDFEGEFPGASALATECFLNLAYLGTAMLASLNRVLNGYGIPSYAGFNALAVLAGAGEPVPPSVVTDRMIVTRPTVTGILSTLEKRGLVARSAHGSDGRMHLVGLTANGRNSVRRVLPEVHRFENDLFGVLDQGQLRTLLGMLDTVFERLDRAGTPSPSAFLRNRDHGPGPF
jgi:DNA-binding MarR family transcriptional regulator